MSKNSVLFFRVFLFVLLANLMSDQVRGYICYGQPCANFAEWRIQVSENKYVAYQTTGALFAETNVCCLLVDCNAEPKGTAATKAETNYNVNICDWINPCGQGCTNDALPHSIGITQTTSQTTLDRYKCIDGIDRPSGRIYIKPKKVLPKPPN